MGVDADELCKAIEHLQAMLADTNHDWGCELCKIEHEQLLRWLEELKERRNREIYEDLYSFRNATQRVAGR